MKKSLQRELSNRTREVVYACQGCGTRHKKIARWAVKMGEKYTEWCANCGSEQKFVKVQTVEP